MHKLTLLDIGPQGSSLNWPWKMYICQKCLSNIPANQPSFNFTTHKRQKHYPKRLQANVFIDQNGKQQKRDDPGGTGYEIVKEIKVCKACFDKLTC